MDSLLHPERLSGFSAICELIGIEMVRDPSVSLGQVIGQAGHTIDAYRHAFDEIARIICSLALWWTEGPRFKIPAMVVFYYLNTRIRIGNFMPIALPPTWLRQSSPRYGALALLLKRCMSVLFYGQFSQFDIDLFCRLAPYPDIAPKEGTGPFNSSALICYE